MESLISEQRCRRLACDRAILGALYRTLALRELEHWFPRRMLGVEDSITLSLPRFSSLLSDIRTETVVTSGTCEVTGAHRDCSPWTVDDENYGDEGTAEIYSIVSEYAEDLEEHAKASGLDPELPPVSRLDLRSSPLFS